VAARRIYFISLHTATYRVLRYGWDGSTVQLLDAIYLVSRSPMLCLTLFSTIPGGTAPSTRLKFSLRTGFGIHSTSATKSVQISVQKFENSLGILRSFIWIVYTQFD
jgi:hypothetical protein